MQSPVKPRTLRPMSKEQKYWFIGTIIFFILFMSVGWYFTVAKVLQKSFVESRAEISAQFDKTKNMFSGGEKLKEKAAEVTQGVKTFFIENLKDE